MADLALSTKKLMVSLAECNFYGAIGIVRKALQSADDLGAGGARCMPWTAGAGLLCLQLALPLERRRLANQSHRRRLRPATAGRRCRAADE